MFNSRGWIDVNLENPLRATLLTMVDAAHAGLESLQRNVAVPFAHQVVIEPAP